MTDAVDTADATPGRTLAQLMVAGDPAFAAFALDRLRAEVTELRDQRDAAIALAVKAQKGSRLSSFVYPSELLDALGVTE